MGRININLTALPLVQLLVGYEFVSSGWSKFFVQGSFPGRLAGYLKDFAQVHSGWYMNFANNVISPQAVFFGYLVEWGQFLAGLAIIAGGLFFLFSGFAIHKRYMFVAGLSMAALAGAVLLNLNLRLAVGASPPLPGLGNSNGGGVTDDIFGILIPAVLVWWNAIGLVAALAVKKGSVTELRRYREKRAGRLQAGTPARPAAATVAKVPRGRISDRFTASRSADRVSQPGGERN